MTKEEGTFEPLPLRRRVITAMAPDSYSIISKNGEVREIKANTAYEAFKLSGLREAIKIERKALERRAVLPKSRFVEESAASPVAKSEDMKPILLPRKSPVVTADDLDAMMRTLQAEGQAQLASPPPAEALSVVTNPTGVEVHGDGFDELIPASIPPGEMGTVKQEEEGKAEATVAMEASPKAEAAEPAKPEPSPVDAPKELSEEEINKLLSGQQ